MTAAASTKSRKVDAPFPRLTHSLPRPYTMLLFGCWLSDQRRKCQLSTEEFAARCDRTPEWVASIEAGVCLPSPAGFAMLQSALVTFDPAYGKKKDPIRIAQQLELDPWGKLARKLRQRHQLSPDIRGGATVDQGGILPLVADIRYRDQLLTITPMLGLALIIGLVLLIRPWGALTRPEVPNIDAVVFFGFVGIVAAAVEIQFFSRLVDRVVSAARLPQMRDVFANIAALRSMEEVPLVGLSGWYQPGERPYLIPTYLDLVEERTKRVDITERSLLLLAVTSSLVVLTASIALIRQPTSTEHWILIAGAILLAILAARLSRQLIRRAHLAVGALLDAYGAP